MKTFRSFTVFSLIILAGVATRPSLAQTPVVVPPVVVFDSFGAGNAYNHAIVWGVTGAAASGGYRGQAESFVPGVSGTLSSFTLATYRFAGSGRSDFFIAQDNGSGPGTILESFPNTVNNANGLLTINSSGNPLLQAGVKYWLCDEPTDSTTSNGWYYNSQGQANGFAFERSQWSWSPFGPPPAVPASGVFRVSVIPVPEPSMLALVMPGAWFLISRFKRGAVLK